MNIPFKFKLREITLLAEAWIFMAFARFCIVLFSFEKLMKLLGRTLSSEDWEDANRPLRKWAEINRAIQRASRYSFWRTKCFEQALTAKWMLRWRGYTSKMYFGVRKDQAAQMTAHAWVICEGEMVTGGNMAVEYMILTCFI